MILKSLQESIYWKSLIKDNIVLSTIIYEINDEISDEINDHLAKTQLMEIKSIVILLNAIINLGCICK